MAVRDAACSANITSSRCTVSCSDSTFCSSADNPASNPTGLFEDLAPLEAVCEGDRDESDRASLAGAVLHRSAASAASAEICQATQVVW
jgi:hypothetical protein